MHLKNKKVRFGKIGASFILKFGKMGAPHNSENSERLEPCIRRDWSTPKKVLFNALEK